jgi:hypothetical protein
MRKFEYLLGVLLLLTAMACNAAPGPGTEGIVTKVAAPGPGTKEGIVAKVADPSGSYCHLKFPAIRKETLYWDRPVLTDPSEGDIIDFYGPCDHDPLGKEEVLRQRRHLEFERHLGFDDE